MKSAEKAALGEVVTTQKGYAFKSAWYTDSGRPIVKVSDFTDDSVYCGDLICIPEEVTKDYLQYELGTRDVVVQTVGSWPSNPASVVGKCVRIPKNAAGALLNQNAVKLTPSSRIDSGFLYYLLRNEDFKTYIVGTAQVKPRSL
jgi:type I restriction enzyme S subunit